MSVREAAIAALHAVLEAAMAARSPAPLVLRNETVPQRLPPGGLIVVRDGETVEEMPLLSPLAWQVEHRAEVEVTATSAVLLDALLVDIGTAIVADRTLGRAVDWCQPGSPSFEDVEFEGAAAVRAASVPVSLHFTVAATPLS